MKKIEYNRGRISPAKEIAAVAVMCALLIGGQLALSFVSGVEVVTVLLLSFSFTYGRRAGALTAILLSLSALLEALKGRFTKIFPYGRR